jgi:simple sugar transport system ATP-binding protein
MADGTPRISLRNIRKNFGSLQALRGIDLDIHPGECLGLVGDNAAGKSTLTKIISGVYIPDDGTISVDGVPVRLSGPAEARNRNIEMVFQDLSLCDHIDVVGNLFLGASRG